MMPSKKKKYNARFPAGRIKKIMQTDEEVGKVAQAVPVIISRTLELFVQSLLVQATRITTQRNAKTLSPSHLKQCILHEARFDFLRDLVKNIPDVSAAEEKEMQSGENSPNSAGYSEQSPSLRRPQEKSSTFAAPAPDSLKRRNSDLPSPLPAKTPRTETVTSVDAIDLTKKPDNHRRNLPNFYQETLPDDDTPETHSSVIRVNPSYANPQPSTSQFVTLTTVKPTQTAETVPKMQKFPLRIDLSKSSTSRIAPPLTPAAPITPVINIDFTKNISNPEIHVLDTKSINVPAFAASTPRIDGQRSAKIPQNYTVKALSRSASQEHRKVREVKSPLVVKPPVDIDRLNSGNLEIDEDYDT